MEEVVERALLSSSDTGVDVIRGRTSEFGVFPIGLAVENDWLRLIFSSLSLLFSSLFFVSAVLLSDFFELFRLRLEKLN